MAEEKKVLIMDDKRENIVFLANKILRPSGYSVVTAMDGEKGLNKALEEKPDLIVMDLKMPKKTGLEVLEALREKGYDIPVIVMTFHGSEAAAVEAFRLGARDYIIKPFTVEEMLAAIERALEEEEQAPRPEIDWEKVELADELMEVNDVLQKSIDELSALHDVGRALTSILYLEKVLSLAVETAIPLIEAEEGSLFLVDEQRGDIYLSAVQRAGDEHARVCSEKTDDDLIAQVVKTGEVVTISRFLGEGEGSGDSDYSLMAVPMKIGERIIGVIAVKSTAPDEDFTDNDRYLLSILADYTAISTENARLYGQARFEIERLEKARGAKGQAARGGVESQISRMEAEQLARQLRALTLAAERLAQRLHTE
jgi:two-component system NtrC family sensor kinase